MNGATFKTIREGLGFTTQALADHLSIATRTIDRWEAGTSLVPEFAAEELLLLEANATEVVDAWVESLAGRDDPALVLATGPDDMPLRWQRAVAFRVRQRVPGLAVVHDGRS